MFAGAGLMAGSAQAGSGRSPLRRDQAQAERSGEVLGSPSRTDENWRISASGEAGGALASLTVTLGWTQSLAACTGESAVLIRER